MPRKQQAIAILQFNEQFLSVLTVEPSASGVHVSSREQLRGPWAVEDGSLQEALNGFVQGLGLAGQKVYAVIPRHEVATRILELPSQDPDEIEGMVRLSAEEFVPYPLEELVIAQHILEKMEDGSSRVFVVIAHRDVVQRYLDLLEGAGIVPEQILSSTACLISASLAGRPHESRCSALVNLTTDGMEVLIMRGRRLEYGRGVAMVLDWDGAGAPSGGPDGGPEGGPDGVTEATSLDEVASELRSSIAAHGRETHDGAGVEVVLVCSESGDPAPLLAALERELGLECKPATDALALVKAGWDALGGIPLVSLGAALAAQGRAACSVGLLPEPVLRRRAVAAARKQFLRMGAVMGVVVAALGALYFQSVYQRQAYIAELEERVEAIRPRAQNIMTKQRHLERLQRQVEQEGTALELLAGICELAPSSGLNLTRFSFRHGQRIKLYGRSKELRYVDALAEDLRAAGEASFRQFAQAQVVYTNDAFERTRSVIDFSISLEFPRTGGEEDE